MRTQNPEKACNYMEVRIKAAERPRQAAPLSDLKVFGI